MGFQEAMTRARAAHVVVKTIWQPGNDYVRQYVCRCGKRPFARNWNQHVLNAADAFIKGEAERSPSSKVPR